MRKLLLGLASAVALACVVPPQASQAQILLVSGNYRITELDQAHERFGVALPEAKPNETQNWIYIGTTTDIQRRVTNRQGCTKTTSSISINFSNKSARARCSRFTAGGAGTVRLLAKR